MIDEGGRPVRSEDHPSMITFRTGEPIRGAVRGLFSGNPDHTRWLLIDTEPRFSQDGGEVEEVVITFLDITEIRRTERALQVERDKARQYLEVVEVMLIALDRDGLIEMINRRGFELLEAGESELLGRDWFETCLPPEVVPQVRGVFEKLMAGEVGPVEYSENEVVTATGKVRTMAWHNALMRTATGEIRGIFSSGEDVTEHRKIEKDLRASEERYRQLFREMQEGFAVHEMIWDQEGNPADYRFLEVNPAFEKLTGLRREDLLGKRMREVLPGTEDHWVQRCGEVVRSGDPVSFQSDFGPLGRHYQVSVFRSDENQFAVTFSDVTARIDAERARAENEERLALAQRVGRIGLMDRDMVKDVEVWSPVTYEILGLDPETTTPGPAAWIGIVHPEDRPRAVRSLGCLLHGEDSPVEEYRVVGAGGEIRWVRVVVRVFPSPDGGPLGRILGTVQDITAEQRSREDLLGIQGRLRALAARHATIREEERASISRELHDELGQTLTGLRMDLALDRSELPEGEEALKDRFQRLIKVTDENIDMVRELSSRLRPPILDVLGLGPAIEWQVDEYRPRTSIRFHLDLPEDGPVLPDAHRIAFFRIAQESLTNVFRHSEAETVWVTLKVEDGAVLLQVEDDGKGIPLAKVGGLRSLGLLGMEERALGIGGALSVEPRKGGGTVVRITAPVPEDEPSNEQTNGDDP